MSPIFFNVAIISISMSKLSIDVSFVAKSGQLIPKLSILQMENFCLICCYSLAVKSKMVRNFKSSPKNNYFFKKF